jgi:hypothetical protein
MKRGNENTLQVLKNELKFLQKGGYRALLVWRVPLVFEDSPTCPKERFSACPDADCVLMNLVPTKCRDEAVVGASWRESRSTARGTTRYRVRIAISRSMLHLTSHIAIVRPAQLVCSDASHTDVCVSIT